MDADTIVQLVLGVSTAALAVATFFQARSARSSKLTAVEQAALASAASKRADRAEAVSTALTGQSKGVQDSALALERRATTAERTEVLAQLADSRHTFRWAADIAMKKDPDDAVPGILMLSTLISDDSGVAKDAQLIQKLVLRSQVLACLIGILVRNLGETDADGSGTLVCDVATRAIANVLASQEGLKSDIQAKIQALALAQDGEVVHVNQFDLLDGVQGLTMSRKLTQSRYLNM